MNNRIARWREQNPERVKASAVKAAKRWRAKNPGKVKALNARRNDPEYKEKLRLKALERRQVDPIAHAEKLKAMRESGYARNSWMKHKYGMTLAQYESMLHQQGNKCLICEVVLTPGTRGNSRPVIDHCHTTGRVRGVLCSKCNIVIHKDRATPEYFMRVIRYLERSNNGLERL